MVFSLSLLWWKMIRALWKLPDGRDWLRGKLGLVLMGGAMLSKSLIWFSFDGWGFVPSLLFDLRPNYGGGNEDNVDLLQKVPFMWLQSRTRLSDWTELNWNSREGTQLHSSTENWIKDLLSMAPPIRPNFPFSQCHSSGSFHKPLILMDQRADRKKTTTEN